MATSGKIKRRKKVEQLSNPTPKRGTKIHLTRGLTQYQENGDGKNEDVRERESSYRK